MTALVCEVRYRLDPDRMEAFRDYAVVWMTLTQRHGGTHYGFFLPGRPPDGAALSFAGKGRDCSGDVAVALFSFRSDEAYRQYRDTVARDPDAIEANARFADPPFLSYERRFLRPLAEFD